MLKIGITGGIGSGKTTVCKIFELLGIPVFYSDAAAKEVMKNDAVLIVELKTTFGEDTYFANGELNRTYLASKAFADISTLEKLNAIVHPAVFRAFDRWVSLQTHSPYVIKEAAILFESNSYIDCNHSILVKAPLNLKIDRVIKRDNITKEDVLKRMEKQWTDEKKEALADFTLNNNEQEFLIPEVLKLHKRFLEESNK